MLLAKSTYSAVLADLGQVDHAPSLVTNVTALEATTQVFSDIRIGDTVANALPGPATGPYDASSPSSGPLILTPSTISAEYLCQIPQRKSTGTLIFAILVANLDILSASGQSSSGSSSTFLDKRPRSQECVGCASRSNTEEAGYSMMPLKSRSAVPSTRSSGGNGLHQHGVDETEPLRSVHSDERNG